MKRLFIILFSAIIIAGCKSEKKVTPPAKLNYSSLTNLISRASNGIKSANDSLSGLFDLNLL